MAAFGEADDWHMLDGDGRRKYLTGDELTRFLAAADRLAPARRAFCHVLAYTGCRVSEALALTVAHLDAEACTLTFRTLKRRRRCFRTVPVPPPLVAMLIALPLTADGSFWTMHRATAWQLVKTMMRWSQITGPMASPKGLRHAFGICAAGCNIPTNLIQRWMGHASPDTTAIYIDAVGAEERRFASRMW
jgi:integrase